MLVAKNKSIVRNTPGMITLPVFDVGSSSVLRRGLTSSDKKLSTVDWSWNRNYHSTIEYSRVVSVPSDKLVVETNALTDVINDHGQAIISPLGKLIRARCDTTKIFRNNTPLLHYENMLHDAFRAMLIPSIHYTKITVLSEPKRILVEPDGDNYDFGEEPRTELENTCLTFSTLIPADTLFDAIHIAGQGHHMIIEADETPVIMPDTPEQRLKQNWERKRNIASEQPQLSKTAERFKRVIRNLEDITAYPDFVLLPDYIRHSLSDMFETIAKLPLPSDTPSYKVTKRKSPLSFSSKLICG